MNNSPVITTNQSLTNILGEIGKQQEVIIGVNEVATQGGILRERWG